MCELPNITFLNNSSCKFEEYLFVGSTLWTHIYSDTVRDKYNDFNLINGMAIEYYNQLHNECVNYITKTVNNNADKKIIMLPHHLPSFDLIAEKYLRYGAINQCFASHSDNLIKDPIKVWIYGHTHSPHIKQINNVMTLCNPIGYPKENNNLNYECYVDV
jgi:hypothetical protein